MEGWLRDQLVQGPVDSEHAARKRVAVFDGCEGVLSGNGCFVMEDNNHRKRVRCNDKPLFSVDGNLRKVPHLTCVLISDAAPFNWEFWYTQCLVSGVVDFHDVSLF